MSVAQLTAYILFVGKFDFDPYNINHWEGVKNWQLLGISLDLVRESNTLITMVKKRIFV